MGEPSYGRVRAFRTEGNTQPQIILPPMQPRIDIPQMNPVFQIPPAPEIQPTINVAPTNIETRLFILGDSSLPRPFEDSVVIANAQEKERPVTMLPVRVLHSFTSRNTYTNPSDYAEEDYVTKRVVLRMISQHLVPEVPLDQPSEKQPLSTQIRNYLEKRLATAYAHYGTFFCSKTFVDQSIGNIKKEFFTHDQNLLRMVNDRLADVSKQMTGLQEQQVKLLAKIESLDKLVEDLSKKRVRKHAQPAAETGTATEQKER